MSGFPKKLPDGRWKHDFRVGDKHSPRKIRIFNTKADALSFEVQEKAKYKKGDYERASEKDPRTLKEFIADWYRLHGNQLRYNEGTKKKLEAFAERIGNPIARKFTAKHFTDDRADRLAKKLKPRIVNNDLSYVKAMFNEMIRLDHWKYENPLDSVKKIKFDDTEMAFLDMDQIQLLIDDIKLNGTNSSTLLVTKISLVTGARWNEAEPLTPGQLINNRLTFYAKSTKGRRHRTVPITPELSEEIRVRTKGLGRSDRIFDPCYSAFRMSLVKRCKINLPEGQMAHVLRHTFASHFIMSYGNITSLQKIRGSREHKNHHALCSFSPRLFR